jgi:hypothetical protein
MPWAWCSMLEGWYPIRTGVGLGRLSLDSAQVALARTGWTEGLPVIERPAGRLQAAGHSVFLDGHGAVAPIAVDPYKTHATRYRRTQRSIFRIELANRQKAAV